MLSIILCGAKYDIAAAEGIMWLNYQNVWSFGPFGFGGPAATPMCIGAGHGGQAGDIYYVKHNTMWYKA